MNPMKNREKMIEVSKPSLVLLNLDTLIYCPFKWDLAGLLNCFEGYTMAYVQIFKPFFQKDLKNKNNKVYRACCCQKYAVANI